MSYSNKITHTFRQQLNQFFFISSVAIGSIYLVKTVVNNKRDAEFIPDHFEENENGDGTNIAKIQPGLPEPTGKYKRKSQFEGADNAYGSRRGGDRFSGLLDFEWIFGKKD